MIFMQEDKKERSKKREQDRQEMRELINNGVRKEVEAAIMPILEKQQLIEKEHETPKVEYDNILQAMKDIKEKLSAEKKTFPHYPLQLLAVH